MPAKTPPVPPVPPVPPAAAVPPAPEPAPDAIVPPQPNPYAQPAVQPNPYAQPVVQPNPYAQPAPYGAPGAYGYGYPTVRTNPLAIVSFVASLAAVFLWFFGSLTAIITGHIALNQIKKTGEAGHGFALAGLIIGYVGIGLTAIIVVFYVVVFVALISTGSYYGSTYSS
ncbi:MAG TPA: DUF4190 domain-containing protein [Pseudolysinimonas sp.]|jgi:hypothetical protein